MRFEARKIEILKQLKKNGIIEVSEISNLLRVSDITIRRDLDELAKENLLKRTHGGAVELISKPIIHFNAKSDQNLKAKKRIAQKAAEHITDGDTIFMDCGSSTFQMCEFIAQKEIKIITNSLPVIAALHNSKVNLNLIGGELDNLRQAIHGKMAEWHIAQYAANKAFIGADAIDSSGNLWAHSEKEAGNSLAMIQNSSEIYILADQSKIGKKSNLKFYTNDSKLNIITED